MSTIPTRRTTRTTRSAALQNENAGARTTRTAATRTKPPSKDAGGPTTSRAIGTTAASRAKAAAVAAAAVPPPSKAVDGGKLDATAPKRKREALGEVPVANGKNKPALAPAGKGKAKEAVPVLEKTEKKVFDGVVLKAKVTASTTIVGPSSAAAAPAPAARAPFRFAGASGPATRRTTRSTIAVAKDEPDVPVPAERAVLEEVREEEEVVPETELRKSDHMEIDAAPARRASARKPNSAARRAAARSRKPASRVQAEVDDLDAEDHREYKKRRTSSEVGDVERRQVEDALVPGEDEEETAFVHPQRELVLGEIEHDPNGPEWDDLDEDDKDDPQMVSEYVVEIFEYLKEVEQTTMPNPNYMESQKELAWKMRGILTDWLIQVHFRFRLLPETLFLAVNIIDRFLSARVVSLAKLQLVGVACMFIAAKVEEIVAPSASNFLYCADSSYTEVEILQAEKYILKTLDWNLSYPNAMHFLRRISKADEYNVQVRTLGKYLLEISCLEWRLIAAPPSLLAAASIWLARIILNREDWTANLAHYSSYPESALVPTANMMLNYILKPTTHHSFHKKYASKKYLKASLFVQQWALERWEEGVRVDLQAELPALKALIREANERELVQAQADAEARAAQEAVLAAAGPVEDTLGNDAEDTYAQY